MKLKLKFVVYLFMAVLILGGFTAGCKSGGSYTILRGGIETSETYMKGRYERFNGNYFRNLNLEKGDTLTFNLEVNSNKDSLNIRLENKNGEEVFNIEDNTVVNIKKSDSYRVVAIGDNHKGDFFLTWQIK